MRTDVEWKSCFESGTFLTPQWQKFDCFFFDLKNRRSFNGAQFFIRIKNDRRLRLDRTEDSYRRFNRRSFSSVETIFLEEEFLGSNGLERKSGKKNPDGLVVQLRFVTKRRISMINRQIFIVKTPFSAFTFFLRQKNKIFNSSKLFRSFLFNFYFIVLFGSSNRNEFSLRINRDRRWRQTDTCN